MAEPVIVPAPSGVDADSWIIAVSDWVPRAELARMRRERDAALESRAEAWRAGYDAATELVEVGGQFSPGTTGTVLGGMARTLANSRDEMEKRAPALDDQRETDGEQR